MDLQLLAITDVPDIVCLLHTCTLDRLKMSYLSQLSLHKTSIPGFEHVNNTEGLFGIFSYVNDFKTVNGLNSGVSVVCVV